MSDDDEAEKLIRDLLRHERDNVISCLRENRSISAKIYRERHRKLVQLKNAMAWAHLALNHEGRFAATAFIDTPAES